MASNAIEMKSYSKTDPAKGGVINGLRQPKTTGQSSKSSRKVDRKNERLLKVCREGLCEDLSSLLRDRDLVNHKIKGTTPLHMACSYGHLECVKVLMKAGACPTIWDVRGFTPAHCSVYNYHLPCLRVLLDFRPPASANWSQLHTGTPSQHRETLLHIACLRGNLELVQFLVRREADVTAVDKLDNTVLHYAASSDNDVLVKWVATLLREEEGEGGVDKVNKYGQTAAHRACILGCPTSLSVLSHYKTNLLLQDKAGYTPVDLARLLGNRECYDIGCGKNNLNPLPPSPPSNRSSFSRSTDNLSMSQSSGRLLDYMPQRSLSNGSNSTPPLQRQPSITGGHRPHNLHIRRSSKGSLSSIDDPKLYLSKKAAMKVAVRHQKSRSWDNTQQVIYNSTAYEPPPDIQFIPPIEKISLTRENSRFFSDHHDIKIKISPEHWLPKNQPPDPNKLDPNPPDPTVSLCVAAAMHLNQPFPSGYTIVSPIYFISCRSDQPCHAEVTLPHAVTYDKRRLCILSTTTISPTLQPEVWSPGDRSLSELDTELLEADVHRVKFRTSLDHPSLYAVAVNEKDFSLEPHLPLRCSLFVSYPDLQSTASVSGLYVVAHVGMSLKSVHTAVANQTTKDSGKLEEKSFTLSSESLRVDAGLTNQSDEWIMTSRDSGEFTYNQLSLTQETHTDSISHLPAYPPNTQFFVEPRGVTAAVKCRVRVLSSDGKEICFLKVVPFAPSREVTPIPNQPPAYIAEHSQVTPQDSQGQVTTV